jgi:hypothetical protein
MLNVSKSVMKVRSGKKHKIYACNMSIHSSIKNKKNLISNPMEQDNTNPKSGESVINTKDETIINNE